MCCIKLCLVCEFSVSLTSCGIDFLEQRAPSGITIVVQVECALHETVKSLQLYR